MIGKGQK